MGGKSGVKLPKVKVKAPKITVGKDLGTKKIGKIASSAASSTGKIGGDLAKIVEGNLKAQGKFLTGDFKGAGEEALRGFTSGGNIAGELGGNVGGLVGDRKTGDIAGRMAADIGANVATGGGSGLAKTAAQSLAGDGLQGLLSGKGLQEAALAAAGSYAGVDPNMLKMGLSASQGDLKGAALSGLSLFGGFDPKQLEMASTGVSALTGDKKGLASGLASQFGASDTPANMLGAVAGGDVKGEALRQLASVTGLDPKMLDNISKGKLDPKQLAGTAGFDPKQLLGGASSMLGISSFTDSPEAQEMMRMGQSAGRIVESADAYADDAQNRALDAQSAYKIAKGDSFNAIAKKLGVTPEQLKAANPQIKDINKIAAGANLNIPSSVKTPYETPEQTAARRAATDATAVANAEKDQSTWDKIKTGVGSAVGGAKDFVAENKGLIGLGAQAGAAGLGYMASKEGMEAQQKLIKDQLKQEQAMGSELLGKKYDPARYAQEQEFLAERIRGQGRTALTRQMEQESIQKGARTAAAGRLAGLEQQARLGGAALGTAGLASSLAGAQAGQNVMAEDMRARDVQAQQDLERAVQRTGALSSQATEEEAKLAQQKFGVESGRATSAGATRSQLAQIEGNKAGALANLYTSGANLVQQGLQGMQTPAQQQVQQQQPQQQQPQKQTPPPARVDAARTMSQGAPQRQQPKPAPKPNPVQEMNQRNTMPQPGAGQGYGVLAPVQQVQQTVQQGQQAVQKAQSTFDEAKKKAEEFKKDPLGSFGIKF